ncbi:hypothetical protein CYY_005560 [Polysphondylium violaceum]|uniref:Uncharacterized protein n=1 Tax=Polysphondylium violaceum TaxID=133409 RepID=A0A8J4PW58_9MYCE|nr:hypothetical protein CYY_005560 [Polysphondylium violaceum]
MKSFILLILSLSLLISGNSAIPQTQFDAFIALANKASLDTSSRTIDNVCLWDDDLIQCHADTITFLSLNFTLAQTTVSPSEFAFPNLTDLNLKSTKLTDNFANILLRDYCINLSSLSLINCDLQNITITERRLINLNIDENPLSNVQNLSSVNHPNFFSAKGTQNEFTQWVNDLPSTSFFDGLDIKTSKYPDLSTFDSIQFLNIEPSSKLTQNEFKLPKKIGYSIGFRNNQSLLKFPTLIGSDGHSFHFYLSNISFYVTEPLDLSRYPFSIISIDDSTFSHLDGSFPISKFNTLKMEHFQMTKKKGNLALDFNVLKTLPVALLYYNEFTSTIPSNINFYDGDLMATPINDVFYKNRLDISSNQFTGPIPKWFCNVKAKFSNNKFNGQLPSCYTCHLNLSSTWDAIFQNNFENVQDGMSMGQYPKCTTMKVDQVFISSNTEQGQLYNFNIKGTDLGWENGTVTILGVQFEVTAYKYSEWFYIPVGFGIVDDSLRIGNTALVKFQTGPTFEFDISNIFDDIIPASPAFPPKPSSSSSSPSSSSSSSDDQNSSSSDSQDSSDSQGQGGTTTTTTTTTTGNTNPSSTTTTTTTTTPSPTNEPSSSFKIHFSFVFISIITLIVTIIV